MSEGVDLDVSAVAGGSIDEHIAHANHLIAFTYAVMNADADAIAATRADLRSVLADDAFVDTCAIIGAFNVVTRIADATGIPLDEMMLDTSAETRTQLGINQFPGARNSPAAVS